MYMYTNRAFQARSIWNFFKKISCYQRNYGFWCNQHNTHIHIFVLWVYCEEGSLGVFYQSGILNPKILGLRPDSGIQIHNVYQHQKSAIWTTVTIWRFEPIYIFDIYCITYLLGKQRYGWLKLMCAYCLKLTWKYYIGR